ncbi:MAG: methyltransferase domain-containing protein [Oligoflexus sp.]|nr:methyltransferase domain-containing protein [Oligoflexus sp.]
MFEKFSKVDVSIGTVPFQLHSLKDVYSEFTNHLDNGDGYDEPPLYGILWPSAEGLAWSLWQNHRETLAGKKVLELGCGLALPSLLAAKFGADVTAMDNHKNFERVLVQNMAANHVTCKAAVGSFADPTLKLGTFDWIIASDILYEPDLYPGLEQFILDHISPGGQVLIADPGRYAASKLGLQLKAKSKFQKLNYKISSGQDIDLYSFQF